MGVNISLKTLLTVFLLNAALAVTSLCKQHCFFTLPPRLHLFLSLSLSCSSLWISWLNECDLVSGGLGSGVPELGPLRMNIKCVCGICVWGLKLEITSLTNQLWASLSVCLCTRRKEGVDWERERNRAGCDGVGRFISRKCRSWVLWKAANLWREVMGRGCSETEPLWLVSSEQ